MANAYIQLVLKDDKAYSKYVPPTDGGLKLDISEVYNYLKKHGIEIYDLEAVTDQISENKPSVVLLANDCHIPEFNESMKLKMSLDHMKVTATFAPPSSGGNFMGLKDILEVLNKKGIIYGIDQDAILDFINDRQYNTPYVIAKGDLPVIGHDAKIIYNFNTNPNLKPKMLPDGSVDFKNLNTISMVNGGDLLATLIPADTGKNGKDVYGRDIPVRKVKDAQLCYGDNISVSGDGRSIYSEIYGHVFLDHGKVTVQDEYLVKSDVDNSTGNITYNGNVHIMGSVRTGFTVKADADIIVDGVVEGAYLDAGGQIIVREGVHGMNRGFIKCKGAFISSFIENARVYTDNYVESGSILYSDVNAKGDILVMNRKGFIAGSSVRAGGKVESVTIGSEMGVITRIEVGIDPDKKARYNLLQRQILDESKQIEKVRPVIDTYDNFVKSGKKLNDKNMDYLTTILQKIDRLKTDLEKHREEFNSLHQELLMSKQSKVIVHSRIYPGVTITISELSMTTTEKLSCVQFEKKNGEIVKGPATA
ncbi:MAG: DUF342 domain-containing protein [Lachnospiraceae bacterium]|uniref:DUF342 domain-containing protein n=1 Tax=Candidatus Weimeria bifida TaxID=2599074 RepID=A0A6N7IYH2_9FIRM|nr:DUF342 domain-containing protein [Candidatus Weimeria bifida]RRF96308.1 MAG: DUF342 domain-containing protein [Lachnospiraceae bacterium]